VDAATLFGLVDTGELFASTDDGATWEVHATLPVRDAVGIAAGSTTSELYLASRGGAVYRSDDGGNSWAAVGAVATCDVVALGVRPDEAVMLLTESGVVYSSTDKGATFAARGTITGSNSASLVVVSTDTLFSLMETGEVNRSVDGGVDWTTVGVIPVSDGVNLRVLDSELYVLTGTGGIYRSEDGGSTWMPVGTLSQVHMIGFISDGTQLFAATREGHVATSVDGVDWTWLGSINQLSVMALGTDVPAASIEEPTLETLPFSLGQNYPNPLKARTQMTYIPFDVTRASRVELRIYDSGGRLVRRLFEGDVAVNQYRIPWRGLDDEGTRVSAGVYYYELRAEDHVSCRKAIVIR
jgi:photosystem II stability/assembly factor-like uncharacterized protein